MSAPTPCESSSRPSRPELVRPERPVTRESAPQSGCLGMALAGMTLLACLMGLVLLSSGLFAYALVAGLAFFGYALFHYLVWGWWLSARIRREVDAEEAGDRTL